MESRYATYDSGNSGQSTDYNVELIFTPYSEIEAEVASVFGTSSQYGESLGVVFEDTEIIDGCMYFDEEKGKYKLFSWQESNDMSPQEQLERGGDPHASDANDFIRKTYAGNDKEYELIAARVPEVTDEDGEVVIEASSVQREVSEGEDGSFEYTDFEDLGGDTIPFEDTISWYSGSSENGPSVSSRELAEVLTEYGDLATEDEDDIHNWLRDTSGQNVLREDLEDTRVRFFTVRRDGEDYTYNLPILEDAETGTQLQADNRIGGSDDAQEAAEADAGTYPEPIADYLDSGNRLDLDPERAEELLQELIEDEDNSLTQEMVDDYGGTGVLVSEVV